MSYSMSFSENRSSKKPAYSKNRYVSDDSSKYNSPCKFMNTPTGCTNLHCPYAHPKGYIHACIFGANCKKRATGECHLLHPDERGFTVPQVHDHHNKHPRREAPSPPRDTPSVPTQNTHPQKDEYGHDLVYGEDGNVIGLIDNGHFVSFSLPDDITLEVQEADNAWNKEVSNFDPEHSDDEYETDPDAYEDDSVSPMNPDDYETDPKVYGFDC